MSKKKKQAPPWRAFVWGILVSLGMYIGLVLLLALLAVRGILGEGGTFPAIAAACGASALVGGLVCVREAPVGRLPAALLCGGCGGAGGGVPAVLGGWCYTSGLGAAGVLDGWRTAGWCDRW